MGDGGGGAAGEIAANLILVDAADQASSRYLGRRTGSPSP